MCHFLIVLLFMTVGGPAVEKRKGKKLAVSFLLMTDLSLPIAQSGLFLLWQNLICQKMELSITFLPFERSMAMFISYLLSNSKKFPIANGTIYFTFEDGNILPHQSRKIPLTSWMTHHPVMPTFVFGFLSFMVSTSFFTRFHLLHFKVF